MHGETTTRENRTIRIDFGAENDDIYSIEYKGLLYINLGYNSQKYGEQLFNFSI